MPGTPNSLPRELIEKWEEAKNKTPKERNAIVNLCTDKGCSYSDSVKIDKDKVKQFITTTSRNSTTSRAHGVTYSDLQNEWGGDETGARRIAMALDRGDLIEKKGMLFRKSQMIEHYSATSTDHKHDQEVDAQVS